LLMTTLDTEYKILNTKYLFLALLFLLAFGERVLFDFGANMELVTTALILSSFYVGRKTSFWLIFFIMLGSDLLIGNTNIFIFTWSGFLIPSLLAHKFSGRRNPISRTVNGLLAGISTVGFFFVWTNFGVWLLGSMYPKTLQGLILSYINALPFLRMQAISTLVFIPFGFLLTELAIALDKKWQLEKRLNSFSRFKIKAIN